MKSKPSLRNINLKPWEIIVLGGDSRTQHCLFASKNSLDTTVFDTDQTWLH